MNVIIKKFSFFKKNRLLTIGCVETSTFQKPNHQQLQIPAELDT